jgi:hypothetical protein
LVALSIGRRSEPDQRRGISHAAHAVFLGLGITLTSISMPAAVPRITVIDRPA